MPERAAVVARVRRALRRERFPLAVEDLQKLFQDVEDPFEVLPRAGVFLSNGKNYDVMFEAFIDLWNYTPRKNLGGASPVERLRRRALDTGDAADQQSVHSSYFCVAPHNLDLLAQVEGDRG